MTGWKRVCIGFLVAAIFPAKLPAQQLGAKGDSVARAAFLVLKEHCHRCHGVDNASPGMEVLNHKSLLGPGSDGGKWLVRPGKLNESRLWQRIAVDRDMPPEKVSKRLTEAELAAVNEWILAGAPEFPRDLSRPFISETELLTRIKADLADNSLVAPSNRVFQRYFSLANLHNNPKYTADDLRLARAGFVKLVNSLSRSSRLVYPKLVDSTDSDPYTGVLFRVDVRDVGWDIDTFKKAVVKGYPYALKSHDNAQRLLQEDLTALWGADADGVAYFRVDWFASVASQGEAYYALLGLPKTIAELEADLGVDSTGDFKMDRVRRAGFAGSGISRHNRVVDRHPASRTGYYYRSYDFGRASGNAFLPVFPLGPESKNSAFSKVAFREDGGEIIWRLSNGLQGYYVVDQAGNRLAEAPVTIVRDLTEISGRPIVVNGISCIGCHANGLHDYRDSVRTASALTGEIQAKVDRLYAGRQEIDQLVSADRRQFLRAQEELLLPYLKDWEAGQRRVEEYPESLSFLVRQYFRDLTLTEVCCELGYQQVNPALFTSAKVRELGLRPLLLDGGKIPRETWSTLEGNSSSLYQRIASALDLGHPVQAN